MTMNTVRPNARVRIVRMHPRHQEMTVQPINHDGTHDGPETKMACEMPASVYAQFGKGQIVDLWTTDGLALDRRTVGRSMGKIHALSFPLVTVGRAAAIAIAANTTEISKVLEMPDDTLFVKAEAFMRSRVGEVEGPTNILYGNDGGICMSMNTRGMLYEIQTHDAGRITICLTSAGELTTIFFKKTDDVEINWRNGELDIFGLTLSETVTDGLVGKDVRSVVDNPLLCGKITEAALFKPANTASKNLLRMKVSLEPLGSFVPGSQWSRQ